MPWRPAPGRHAIRLAPRIDRRENLGTMGFLSAFTRVAACAAALLTAGAGRGAPANSPSSPKADPAARWEMSVQTSPRDGTRAITAKLPADAPIASGFDHVTPTLVLRYQAGRASAFVLFDTFLGNGAQIAARVTFGGEEPQSETWAISNDSRAAFPPGDALKFIDRLKRSEHFSLRVEPHKGQPVTAAFTTTGVDVVIKALLAAGFKYSD